MRSTFRLTALLAALVAMLALTSTAMAKGGGGGGGGATCATIDSLTVNPTATGSSLDAVVTMNCFDEHSGAVAFDYINPDTGVKFARAVIMSNYGTRTYSIPLGASTTAGARTLFTVTVYAPNGKVQDTRSITVG
jgi:hypothetical protein